MGHALSDISRGWLRLSHSFPLFLISSPISLSLFFSSSPSTSATPTIYHCVHALSNGRRDDVTLGFVTVAAMMWLATPSPPDSLFLSVFHLSLARARSLSLLVASYCIVYFSHSSSLCLSLSISPFLSLSFLLIPGARPALARLRR